MMIFNRLCFCMLLVFAAVISSCSSKKKYAETNKIYQEQVKEIASEIAKPLSPPYNAATIFSERSEGKHREPEWVGTVNFNVRKPNFVVLHHTAQDSLQQTLTTFTLTRTQVSAHYVIGKNGQVYHMLSDYLRAWHAGSSKWAGITDMNSISIGIELDNNGSEPYTEGQINSLMNLLDTLKTNYKIPPANFIGHGDIAPGRKIDPNINFPWKRLADRGFGIWYDDTLNAPPPSFNPIDGLLILGYDVSKPSSTITAFKRHYLPDTELNDEWTDYALSVLYNLYLKKKLSL